MRQIRRFYRRLFPVQWNGKEKNLWLNSEYFKQVIRKEQPQPFVQTNLFGQSDMIQVIGGLEATTKIDNVYIEHHWFIEEDFHDKVIYQFDKKKRDFYITVRTWNHLDAKMTHVLHGWNAEGNDINETEFKPRYPDRPIMSLEGQLNPHNQREMLLIC